MTAFIFGVLVLGLSAKTLATGSIGAGIAAGLLGIAVAILEKSEVE